MQAWQLGEFVERTINDLKRNDADCPNWILSLLQSFAYLGKDLKSNSYQDAAPALFDSKKGPRMAILIHAAVTSGQPGTALGMKGLGIFARKEGEFDWVWDRGVESGRLEWPKEIEVSMVGGVEERAGDLYMEAGVTKWSALRKLFLLKR